MPEQRSGRGGVPRPRRWTAAAAVLSHGLMLKPAIAPTLIFPHPAPPQPGSVIEVAPGILWLRLALPYRLDHVNVYLLEDGAGFALLDTGLDDAPTRAAWEALLAGGP